MKLLLQFVRYIEACVTSPDWLDKFHSFFSASFLLAKESEKFIFLGIFCNLLVQSFLNFHRVGSLFCENNQKWPKTKHCFYTLNTSDTFDRSDSNEKFWQIFANAEDRGQFPRTIQAGPLSWLNFVTSHSSWEASKIKSSKTNRWIIIVTDYQTWAGKLQFFWYFDFWISDLSTFKT